MNILRFIAIQQIYIETQYRNSMKRNDGSRGRHPAVGPPGPLACPLKFKGRQRGARAKFGDFLEFPVLNEALRGDADGVIMARSGETADIKRPCRSLEGTDVQEHWCLHWLEGLTLYTHTTEDRASAVALLGELLESDKPCAVTLAGMRAAAVLTAAAEAAEALTGDLKHRRDSKGSSKVRPHIHHVYGACCLCYESHFMTCEAASTITCVYCSCCMPTAYGVSSMNC